MYLTDNIHHLLDMAFKDGNEYKYHKFSVRLKIEDKIIPEKLMWSMVVRNLPNAEELVTAYIDKLCQLAASNDTCESSEDYCRKDLPWSAQEYQIGAYALIEYLDWRYEIDSFVSAALGKIFITFLKYLKHCDLDHETWQDDYIRRILSRFNYSNSEAEIDNLMTLLHFRLFNGQSSILALEKDYDYLYRLLCFKGGLQKIIKIILNDNYLKEDGELFYSEYIYLKLCACVYGSDEAKTIEVLDFIKQKVGDDLFACSKYEIAELETIKSKADAFLGSRFPLYEKLKGCTNCPDDLDSGFHRYVIKEQTWYTNHSIFADFLH
jgi:hypothetical protein